MQQHIYKIDEVLLRVGTALAIIVVVAMIIMKPWQSQLVTGEFIIAVPGANGTVMEIREDVVLVNGNVRVAMRQLEERYPDALTVMPVLSWDLGVNSVVLALAASGAVVLLITGWRLRRVENRTLTILKTLQQHGRISLREFVANSDFKRGEVLNAIRLINNRGLGFFAVDSATGFILDRRQHQTVSHAGNCDACGAKVAVEIAVPVLQAPRCPYCHAGLDVPADLLRPKRPEKTAKLQQPAPTRLAMSDRERHESRRQARGTTMSIPLFILLVVFCWPAAVGYAVYKFKSA